MAIRFTQTPRHFPISANSASRSPAFGVPCVPPPVSAAQPPVDVPCLARRKLTPVALTPPRLMWIVEGFGEIWVKPVGAITRTW